MLVDEALSRLKNLTNNPRISQKNLASALGVKEQAISNKKNRSTHLTYDEILFICKYFDVKYVDFVDGITDIDYNPKEIEEFAAMGVVKLDTCPSCVGQIDIPYLECLPEEAKLKEITSLHTDLEIIQNHWQRDPEKLRIIPMQGDCLSTYWYPCKNRDILIIDTGSIIPTREGLYCYSTMNNSLIFIAKLSQSIDGTIKIEKFEANGEVVVKPVSLEKQKEVDFRVLGRVIKNVSLAL